MNWPRAERADIGLLLEGTFPYVSGGVSSWVNQVIRGFPEYTFALIFIGSRAEDYGDAKYVLPDNVVHLETHYLHNRHAVPQVRPMHGDPAVFGDIKHLHECFRFPEANPDGRETFKKLIPELSANGGASLETFLYSETAWDFVKEKYQKYCSDPSFVDYFWTVRSMHAPIWMLAEIAENFIPVRAYHTVSTGYAGLLGAMLKEKTGCPLILSEHGIYTKERKIDLFQAQWVRDNRNVFQRDPTEISYFRQLWIRFFQALGTRCYDSADHIVALFEANRLRQVEDGAPAERTRNIPNGVNVARFAALRAQRPASPPPILCLIGRVVPIKDIKTYIRAMRTVVNRMPEAQGWIAGPEDEDPDYVDECRDLVNGLGLDGNIKFLGFQQMTELLPRIGLVVLSSISEGLPLVLLEGFAAGVPAVSTDVGSCRQLIYGLDEQDQAFGAAGSIVNIADPQALAEAALALLTDEAAWHAASEAGIRRVEAHYTQEQMFANYRAIYEEVTTWQA
ncbi:putative glycosyltransferase EpsD [mine drainage metagenome]|uniref:Putative glycosyltransferase EpsD n=1 Tax=mine drainage metagenome TaxID=410659 RepID=A0A1J5R5W0_9ZZZZ